MLRQQQTSKCNPYNFILWLMCLIDVQALLIGSGTGILISALLEKGPLLPPGPCLYLCDLNGLSTIHPDETDALPLILQLNHDTTLLAASIGFLAKELRDAVPVSRCGDHPTELKIRQIRVLELQDALKTLWVAAPYASIERSVDILPPRSLQIYQQVSRSFPAFTRQVHPCPPLWRPG